MEEAKIAAIVNKSLEQQEINRAEARFFYDCLIKGQVDDIYLSALLVATRFNSYTSGHLIGAAQALLDNATTIDIDANLAIDCCGTGGDNSQSINISSLAALVAASCGLKVVKHGNRGVSSKFGSADFFEQLGLNINMTPQHSAQVFSKTGLTFLFAPVYHAGIKEAMNVRNKLKIRTIFNLLGPLVNPARPKYQLLGVYDKNLLELIADCLLELGVKSAWVVHGAGTDEISLSGINYIYRIDQGQKKYLELTASDFGLPQQAPQSASCGSPQANLQAAKQLILGQGRLEHQHLVAANVAAMLKICGADQNLPQLSQMALNVLTSGQVSTRLEQMIALTK